MKVHVVSHACAALAVGALAALSSPASAGLDFTDTATLSGGTNSVASVNGGAFGGVGTSGTIAPGFAPASTNRVVVQSQNPALPFSLATLQWSYTGLNGVYEADYASEHGDPPYNMAIQFGDITVGAGGALMLSEITFSEALSPTSFGSIYSINRLLTSADSNSLLFIKIPTVDTGSGAIPLSERDTVRAVQLQFIFSGPGTQFGIDAVVNPEPATLALFGFGAAGLGGAIAVRRRRAAKPA